MTAHATFIDRTRPRLRQYIGLENAVLDATVSLAINRGFANVTIDAISATSGISKGGVLYHFPSKKQLILALLIKTLNKAMSGDARESHHKCSVLLLLAAAEYPDAIDPLHSELPVSAKCYPSITAMVIDSVSKNIFGQLIE